jgi:transcription initiation factor IIE alpha subunit
MIPRGLATQSMERQVAAETLAAALSPLSVRAIQQRLERILIDDRELLISLQCQLEQIRRELRLLNDDRIVRALDGGDQPIRH